MKKILYFIVVATIMLSGCSKEKDLRPTDPVIDAVAILREFYDSTDGEHWKSKVNWKEVDKLTEMDSINLYENDLSISLSDCGVRGSIPESLISLAEYYNLYIYLNDNELEGSLPEYIGKESMNEVCLYASDNNLTGNIPESWINISELTLDLKKNRLEGKVSELFRERYYFASWSLTPQQEGYRLTGADVAVPSEDDKNTLLAICSSLPEAARTKLGWETEPDPTKWGNRVGWNANGRCSYLDLASLGISFLPSAVNRLDQLQILYADYNDLKRIPDLSGMKMPFVLDISDNSFDHVPEVSTLPENIYYLDMSSNPIRTTIPEELNKLTGLHALYFDEVQFTGIIPVLDKLTKLKSFSLNNCTELDVQNFPDWLTRLQGLRYLELEECNLKGELPEGIRNLVDLRYIELNKNSLEGQVEHLFEDMDKMQHLFIYDNYFSGNLPVMSEKAPLCNLYFAKNEFSGPIPDYSACSGSLSNFWAEDNHLTGNIPEYFAAMPDLYYLNVRRNNLSGELPAAILERLKDESSWFIDDQYGEGFSNYPDTRVLANTKSTILNATKSEIRTKIRMDLINDFRENIMHR